MKALLRNLIVAATLMTFAGQAYASGPAKVIWTFSGFSFDTALYRPSGTPYTYSGSLGGLLAGSTMSFDSAGNLVDFHIVTDGAFSHTYTPADTLVYDPSLYLASGFGFKSGSFYLQIGFSSLPSTAPAENTTLSLLAAGTWENNNAVGTPSDPSGVIRRTLNAGTMTAQYVPEPASMALLGTALLAMGAVIRRRANKQV